MGERPNRQRAKVPRERKLEVWRRDKYRCRYCRTSVCNPSDDLPRDRWATVDHIRPRSQGGKNTLKNLVTACQRCNQDKGSLPASQFIAEGGASKMSIWAAVRMGYSPLAKAREARAGCSTTFETSPQPSSPSTENGHDRPGRR